jgi:hypothetical protein
VEILSEYVKETIRGSLLQAIYDSTLEDKFWRMDIRGTWDITLHLGPVDLMLPLNEMLKYGGDADPAKLIEEDEALQVEILKKLREHESVHLKEIAELLCRCYQQEYQYYDVNDVLFGAGADFEFDNKRTFEFNREDYSIVIHGINLS